MNMKSSKRTYFCCAKGCTDGIRKIVESSPGLVCLIVCGLDGFSCKITRILAFLASLRHTL
jgi:hypothetical protein